MIVGIGPRRRKGKITVRGALNQLYGFARSLNMHFGFFSC